MVDAEDEGKGAKDTGTLAVSNSKSMSTPQSSENGAGKINICAYHCTMSKGRGRGNAMINGCSKTSSDGVEGLSDKNERQVEEKRHPSSKAIEPLGGLRARTLGCKVMNRGGGTSTGDEVLVEGGQW